MAFTRRPFVSLIVLLPILMIDAILEVSFIGTTVGSLHGRAKGNFSISPTGQSSFELAAHPRSLETNQGHTSNGAAGTALVLVGIGGFLVIWLERRSMIKNQITCLSALFTAYTVLTVLSVLLTLSALIYTFIITSNTAHQVIYLSTATANPAPTKYPIMDWTPETWLEALLELPLTYASDRRKIKQMLRIQRGWRYNLIPLLIVGVLVCGATVWEWLTSRRDGDLEGMAQFKGKEDRTGEEIDV